MNYHHWIVFTHGISVKRRRDNIHVSHNLPCLFSFQAIRQEFAPKFQLNVTIYCSIERTQHEIPADNEVWKFFYSCKRVFPTTYFFNSSLLFTNPEKCRFCHRSFWDTQPSSADIHFRIHYSFLQNASVRSEGLHFSDEVWFIFMVTFFYFIFLVIYGYIFIVQYILQLHGKVTKLMF